jgi:hypothetical protein
MRYTIEFQYKPESKDHPYGHIQDEPIVIEDGKYIPIPDVGDSVVFTEYGQPVTRKVVTRHFIYQSDWCGVNLVVTDIESEELSARIASS